MTEPVRQLRDEKRGVQEYYDSFGWRPREGTYNETIVFGDLRRVLARYYHETHLRVKDEFAPAGRYFLDAGSGPIPQPELLEYSAGYRRRVCVDLSVGGLSEARVKLGDRGLYVVADLANLPFRDGTFDAVLSAHVLYHVPADEQELVVRELCRAMTPDASCVIIYQQPSCVLTTLARALNPRRVLARIPGVAFLWMRVVKPIMKGHGSGPGREVSSGGGGGRRTLYAYSHSWDWFRQRFSREYRIRVRPWRSVSTDFTRPFVPDNGLGSWLIGLIFRAESAWPDLFARIGHYGAIVIRKREAKQLSSGRRGSVE